MQHEVKLTHLNPLWLINWLKNFCFIIPLSACVLSQLCLTLWDPIAYNQWLFSVHGVFQAKVVEWVAIPISRGSFRPRDQTHVSCIGRLILYHYCHLESSSSQKTRKSLEKHTPQTKCGPSQKARSSLCLILMQPENLMKPVRRTVLMIDTHFLVSLPSLEAHSKFPYTFDYSFFP